jgi:hypothetical protein
MKAQAWKKPVACRLGMHTYRAAAPPTPYAVEVECENWASERCCR